MAEEIRELLILDYEDDELIWEGSSNGEITVKSHAISIGKNRLSQSGSAMFGSLLFHRESQFLREKLFVTEMLLRRDFSSAISYCQKVA